MKTIAFAICMLAMVALAGAEPSTTTSTVIEGPPPAIPATPAAVDAVLYARKFTLQEGYKHQWVKWSQNQPDVTSGILLVLKVNPALVFARQCQEPVLYVGSQTAERVNIGFDSGHVIAIVPGQVDLATTPIWFGTPELPERVDAATINAERAQAEKAGIKPLAANKVAAALARGGAPLNVADKSTLLRDEVASLIEQYSPTEKPLADAFRTPAAKTAPKSDED